MKRRITLFLMVLTAALFLFAVTCAGAYAEDNVIELKAEITGVNDGYADVEYTITNISELNVTVNRQSVFDEDEPDKTRFHDDTMIALAPGESYHCRYSEQIQDKDKDRGYIGMTITVSGSDEKGNDITEKCPCHWELYPLQLTAGLYRSEDSDDYINVRYTVKNVSDKTITYRWISFWDSEINTPVRSYDETEVVLAPGEEYEIDDIVCELLTYDRERGYVSLYGYISGKDENENNVYSNHADCRIDLYPLLLKLTSVEVGQYWVDVDFEIVNNSQDQIVLSTLMNISRTGRFTDSLRGVRLGKGESYQWSDQYMNVQTFDEDYMYLSFIAFAENDKDEKLESNMAVLYYGYDGNEVNSLLTCSVDSFDPSTNELTINCSLVNRTDGDFLLEQMRVENNGAVMTYSWDSHLYATTDISFDFPIKYVVPQSDIERGYIKLNICVDCMDMKRIRFSSNQSTVLYMLHDSEVDFKLSEVSSPANGSYYQAGENIEYLLTLRNLMGYDIEVDDMYILTYSSTGAEFSNSLDRLYLKPNEEVSGRIEYTVSASDVEARTLINSVGITTINGELNTYWRDGAIEYHDYKSNYVESSVGIDISPDKQKPGHDEEYGLELTAEISRNSDSADYVGVHYTVKNTSDTAVTIDSISFWDPETIASYRCNDYNRVTLAPDEEYEVNDLACALNNYDTNRGYVSLMGHAVGSKENGQRILSNYVDCSCELYPLILNLQITESEDEYFLFDYEIKNAASYPIDLYSLSTVLNGDLSFNLAEEFKNRSLEAGETLTGSCKLWKDLMDYDINDYRIQFVAVGFTASAKGLVTRKSNVVTIYKDTPVETSIIDLQAEVISFDTENNELTLKSRLMNPTFGGIQLVKEIITTEETETTTDLGKQLILPGEYTETEYVIKVTDAEVARGYIKITVSCEGISGKYPISSNECTFVYFINGTELKMELSETSSPANGEYYTIGETIKYRLTMQNMMNYALETISSTYFAVRNNFYDFGFGDLGKTFFNPNETVVYEFEYTVEARAIGNTLHALCETEIKSPSNLINNDGATKYNKYHSNSVYTSTGYDEDVDIELITDTKLMLSGSLGPLEIENGGYVCKLHLTVKNVSNTPILLERWSCLLRKDDLVEDADYRVVLGPGEEISKIYTVSCEAIDFYHGYLKLLVYVQGREISSDNTRNNNLTSNWLELEYPLSVPESDAPFDISDTLSDSDDEHNSFFSPYDAVSAKLTLSNSPVNGEYYTETDAPLLNITISNASNQSIKFCNDESSGKGCSLSALFNGREFFSESVFKSEEVVLKPGESITIPCVIKGIGGLAIEETGTIDVIVHGNFVTSSGLSLSDKGTIEAYVSSIPVGKFDPKTAAQLDLSVLGRPINGEYYVAPEEVVLFHFTINNMTTSYDIVLPSEQTYYLIMEHNGAEVARRQLTEISVYQDDVIYPGENNSDFFMVGIDLMYDLPEGLETYTARVEGNYVVRDTDDNATVVPFVTNECSYLVGVGMPPLRLSITPEKVDDNGFSYSYTIKNLGLDPVTLVSIVPDVNYAENLLGVPVSELSFGEEVTGEGYCNTQNINKSDVVFYALGTKIINTMQERGGAALSNAVCINLDEIGQKNNGPSKRDLRSAEVKCTVTELSRPANGEYYKVDEQFAIFGITITNNTSDSIVIPADESPDQNSRYNHGKVLAPGESLYLSESFLLPVQFGEALSYPVDYFYGYEYAVIKDGIVSDESESFKGRSNICTVYVAPTEPLRLKITPSEGLYGFNYDYSITNISDTAIMLYSLYSVSDPWRDPIDFENIVLKPGETYTGSGSYMKVETYAVDSLIVQFIAEGYFVEAGETFSNYETVYWCYDGYAPGMIAELDGELSGSKAECTVQLQSIVDGIVNVNSFVITDETGDVRSVIIKETDKKQFTKHMGIKKTVTIDLKPSEIARGYVKLYAYAEGVRGSGDTVKSNKPLLLLLMNYKEVETSLTVTSNPKNGKAYVPDEIVEYDIAVTNVTGYPIDASVYFAVANNKRNVEEEDTYDYDLGSHVIAAGKTFHTTYSYKVTTYDVNAGHLITAFGACVVNSEIHEDWRDGEKYPACYKIAPVESEVMDSVKYYTVTCLACTFSGGGYSGATSGRVPEGTVITVYKRFYDDRNHYWVVNGRAYNYYQWSNTISYTVNGDCTFEPYTMIEVN